MLIYATMLSESLLLLINGIALILNCIYLTFYMMYSNDLVNEVLRPLGVGVALIAAMFSYSKYEDPQTIKVHYGIIMSIFMIVLISLPLLKLVSLTDTTNFESFYLF